MGLKKLLLANATVLLLILVHKLTISSLNLIGTQLQRVKLAVNWETASAWYVNLHKVTVISRKTLFVLKSDVFISA